MRREATQAEKVMWEIVRDRSLRHLKFRRQYPVENFILDFYCPRLRVAIEVDGDGHLDEAGRVGDEWRTRELKKLGIRLIRFENFNVVHNSKIVISRLVQEIEKMGKLRK